MYNIASAMNGTPVQLSSIAQAQALSSVQNIQKYGSSLLYVNASKQAYLSGEYGAALYSAEYANIFYNDSNLAYSNANSVNSIVSQALSSPNGIWPEQFALQSKFYLYQASISNSTLAPLYLDNAYSVALLSQGLGNINSYMKNNFVPATSLQNSNLTAQIANLQSEVSLLVGAVVILIAFIVIIILVLIMHLTGGSKNDVQIQQPQMPVQMKNASLDTAAKKKKNSK